MPNVINRVFTLFFVVLLLVISAEVFTLFSLQSRKKISNNTNTPSKNAVAPTIKKQIFLNNYQDVTVFANGQTTYIGTVAKIDHEGRVLSLQDKNKTTVEVLLNKEISVYIRPKYIVPGKNDSGMKAKYTIEEIKPLDLIEVTVASTNINNIETKTIGIFRE